MNKPLTKISKYSRFILRHEPHSIGMKLDDEGYVNAEDLVQNVKASGKSITSEQVRQVVDHEQQLFTLGDDDTRIRVS